MCIAHTVHMWPFLCFLGPSQNKHHQPNEKCEHSLQSLVICPRSRHITNITAADCTATSTTSRSLSLTDKGITVAPRTSHESFLFSFWSVNCVICFTPGFVCNISYSAQWKLSGLTPAQHIWSCVTWHHKHLHVSNGFVLSVKLWLVLLTRDDQSHRR